MEIEVYTVRNCGNCRKVKDYFEGKRILFREVDMTQGGIPELQEKKRWFKEMGLQTYPVTLAHDGKVILQGFDEKEFDEAFGYKE